MKKLIKTELISLVIICTAVFLITMSSLWTTAIVKVTQIIGYLLILLLIPQFIITKNIEAKANIALMSAEIADLKYIKDIRGMKNAKEIRNKTTKGIDLDEFEDDLVEY